VSNELIAVALLTVVHIGALVTLIWALGGDAIQALRPPRGDGPRGPHRPDAPAPRSGGGPPLADAVPSRLRLRTPRRLADAHRPPTRRPAHPRPSEPAPARPRATI
jgi:hypothetical protein